jgi:hypothetical protein
METATMNLTEENKKELGYIQQKNNQDMQSAIAGTIEAYFQQIHQELKNIVVKALLGLRG